MAGIYIHIPFCKTKCHYCNFFSVSSNKYKPEFIDNLVAEIRLQKDYLDKEEVKTVYLGGGTPSVFDARDIEKIIDAVVTGFRVDRNAEITIEANPDDINNKWVSDLKATAINRVSLGVQSFFDEDLAYLSRVHNAQAAKEAIDILIKHGFDALTIDLIYAIPGMDNDRWKKNLEIFFSYNLPHLSSYALTVENKTALSTLISKNQKPAPEEEAAVAHFQTLLELTEKHDYIHYEISNFAKQGYYSRHNSLYWTGGHYLGLGPSAHSYNGKSRRWNKASFKDWLSLTEFYEQSFEEEILTENQRYNEYVMTSLRTIWGCDINIVENEFGVRYAMYLRRQAKKFIEQEYLNLDKNRFFLTNRGKLLADGIAADLFI